MPARITSLQRTSWNRMSGEMTIGEVAEGRDGLLTNRGGFGDEGLGKGEDGI